ncbi:MAG: proline dehydrogenase [Ignavibacteria bacterium]|nr:proline dehydrogenase [Ignavibacteria bacterium]
MNPLNIFIVKIVKFLPKSITFIFARKYIAGLTLADALDVTAKLNKKGIAGTIDVLGEEVQTQEEAIEAKNDCLKVLEELNKNKLDANLSIKPTQFGIKIDEEFAFELVMEVVIKAAELNNFIRIDMEDSSLTDKTIQLFKRVKEKNSNVGIVLQAYMKRTYNDVKALNKINANYRLCKGIYIEPVEIAYKDKNEIRKNFLKCLEEVIDNGNYIGIATHDEFLINSSYKMIATKNVSKDKFEFQMLYGVTENLLDMISKDGYKTRVYIPFGKKWHNYSMRRLQENPQIAWYIFKSLFTIK